MARKIMLAALCLFLAVGLCACETSSGDDDGPYNFNGRWRFTITVTEDPVGWWGIDNGTPVGSTYSHDAVITQNGSNITMVGQHNKTYYGNCDVDKKTFNAAYRVNAGSPTGVVLEYKGEGDGETEMTGTFTGWHGMSSGPAKTFKATFTATLTSR